jgi:hypothetical protein
VAETPEELYARAKEALRAPPVEEWATIWDDVLPPLPEALWRENVAAFARGLG